MGRRPRGLCHEKPSHTIAHDLADILPPPPGTPFQRLRLLAASAFAVVGVFIIGFGFWATYAPLESAAIAGGTIEAKSSRKTIQHLEGGIIGRILVKRRRRGDRRAATHPARRYEGSRHRPSAPGAALGRAGPGGAPDGGARWPRQPSQFPQALTSAAQRDPVLAEVMAGQIKIFDTRRRLQSSRIDVIQQRKAQTKEEIAALRFQAEAATKRAAIIKKEMATVAPMVTKGLQTRARLLQLEREQAEIDGRIGDTLAQVSRAEQAIGESEAMILQTEERPRQRNRPDPARHSSADFPACRAHSGRQATCSPERSFARPKPAPSRICASTRSEGLWSPASP